MRLSKVLKYFNCLVCLVFRHRKNSFHQPGINHGIKQYVNMGNSSRTIMPNTKKVLRRGQKEPLHEGISIFDEVKATTKLKWSSSGQNLVGLALSYKEFGMLNDVHDDINPNQNRLPAEYNLQYLCRDLTCDFDLIGPYSQSAVTITDLSSQRRERQCGYSMPATSSGASAMSLWWRHNERNGVLNNQPHNCLLNLLFRRRSKKTSKLRVTGLFEGNSPIIGEFPAQRASSAENVSIWWRHHGSAAIKLMCVHRRGTFGTNQDYCWSTLGKTVVP